jgi:adenylate cyclase
MAMFGAPRDLPEHALRAARAALEMQKAMGAWNARRTGGLSGLRIGIGINTGAVVGGKVGSKDRLEYTLIGEEVNLASRVCGKAAPGQVLVTKQVFDRLGGRVGGRELEPITVKGLSYPVHVYEVTG